MATQPAPTTTRAGRPLGLRVMYGVLAVLLIVLLALLLKTGGAAPPVASAAVTVTG
ncbi:MAG: hypothetical protein IT204_11000 [Fimbriimonadaceae bacterium]|nr:hypothetical protein [Fimbriimonadaceae bacterium]